MLAKTFGVKPTRVGVWGSGHIRRALYTDAVKIA